MVLICTDDGVVLDYPHAVPVHLPMVLDYRIARVLRSDRVW